MPSEPDNEAARTELHRSIMAAFCNGLIAIDDEDRHVYAACEIAKGITAVDKVKTSADKANRAMPSSRCPGDGELRDKPIAAEPIGIAIDMLPGHLRNDGPADIDPI